MATLAVGVGLIGSSMYGLAGVGQDLELAAARPSTTLVAERVEGYDCPYREAPAADWGGRL